MALRKTQMINLTMAKQISLRKKSKNHFSRGQNIKLRTNLVINTQINNNLLDDRVLGLRGAFSTIGCATSASTDLGFVKSPKI